MATTIQISPELQMVLNKKKLTERETYEEVIWELLEDTMEINEETKKEIAAARAEVSVGKTISLAEVKKKYQL